MKNNTAQAILIPLIIIFSLVVGLTIGRYAFRKEVLVSDRMSDCNKLGGRYVLSSGVGGSMWDYEWCEINKKIHY